MPADLWRRAVSGPRGRRTHASDDGFTLVEVLVSITLMAIVMASLSAFFITTVSATDQQSGRQSATQLAQDAVELVRGLKGSAILTGRAKCGVGATCAAPVAGVAPYLADLEEWDYPTGTAAQLPTTAKQVVVSGVTYAQNWYVGKCWQPLAGGACQKDPGTGPIQFLRLVVGISWSEKHCPANACSVVTSTLINSATVSPLFKSDQTAPPPVVSNPGNQVDDVNWPVSLTLAAAGGAPPLTWTATGLPPGLSLSPAGVVSGSPTSTGSYSVTVTATDGFKLAGSAPFTWTIKPAPTVTTPTPQSGEVTVAATAVQVTAANGVAPYTWSATGLPPGLSINGTGKITGTPTTAGAYSVVATATDAKGRTASSNPFAWNVIACPAIPAPSGAAPGGGAP
jgi:prepilin-type N-terminal cleavage/methylation domain-containing protein